MAEELSPILTVDQIHSTCDTEHFSMGVSHRGDQRVSRYCMGYGLIRDGLAAVPIEL